DRIPSRRFPYLTGVSAGAINISLLASHTGTLREKCDFLVELWRNLQMSNVFASHGASLLSRAFRIGVQLAVGLPPGVSNVYGMVDTQPLRDFLYRALSTKDGNLPGIQQNIDRGELNAVALATLSYGSLHTVTFYQGEYQPHWEQPRRTSIATQLTVEHVMASAALPLFFPPIQIGDDWFGDGGIRLVNPLASALHTRADRILAISNHYLGQDPTPPVIKTPPLPATVMAALYNAVFLDQLDQDVMEMQMINKLVRQIPEDHRFGMREIKLLVIRPSENIGAIAYGLRHKLPTTLTYLMNRLGAGEIRSQDFLSTVMFQSTFIEHLIELGLRDGESHVDELLEFFGE
ncbi:MAG: patatin, partial [Planctomycetes bacterium]|nr:patatin [Planctomycetota bacterium]